MTTSPFPFVAGAVLAAADLNELGNWDTFSPTLTNVTVGNGTESAFYCQLGSGTTDGLVAWYYELLFGSTTAITGSVTITYPVSAVGSRRASQVSTVFCEDSSGTDYYGTLFRNTASVGTVRVFNSSATYLKTTNLGASVPFTWSSGDRLGIGGVYQSAAS